jgi:hypothetical protein
LESTGDRSELFVVSTEDPESDDDRNDGSDPAEGMPGFQNVLKDMIPGVKVKIFKVITPEKVDKDMVSKVIEQLFAEEESGDEDEDGEDDGNEDGEDDVNEEDDNEDGDEEEKESDTESLELEDIKLETEQEEADDEIEINADLGTFEREEQNEIAVKVVIGGLVQKLSSNLSPRDLLRVAAKLEMKGRRSFSFTVENEISQQDGREKGKSSSDKSIKFQSRRRVDHVISDLAKFIGKEKVPAKVG